MVWLLFILNFFGVFGIVETGYYDTLGVKPNAELGEIKKAYRKLAKELHPDNNQGDYDAANEKFQELQVAYDILSDEETRRTYDQYGKEGLEKGFGQGNQGGFGGGMPNDIFDLFRGGFGGQRRQQVLKAEAIEVVIPYSLEDFVKGIDTVLEFQRYKPCSRANECKVRDDTCAGKGIRIEVVRMGNMHMQSQSQDPRCIDRGARWNENCKACPSGNKEFELHKMRITLPPGLKGARTMHVADQGNLVDGAKRGDVILRLEEIPHAIYKRQGHDIHANVSIKLWLSKRL